eukprot:Skav207316  [mRNA]  locus=scaffold2296:381119:382130:- [translate_table: standard]
MFHVTVSLPSGRNETLSLPHLATARDLKVLAQASLGHGFLKLITEAGHVLTDFMDPLEASGIQDGDHFTAVVQQPRVAATGQAFALWCCGGDRIVTWGTPDRGGDSSAVQDQLRNVQQVQGAFGAFAAI